MQNAIFFHTKRSHFESFLSQKLIQNFPFVFFFIKKTKIKQLYFDIMFAEKGIERMKKKDELLSFEEMSEVLVKDIFDPCVRDDLENSQVFANKVNLKISSRLKNLYIQSSTKKKEEMLSVVALSACLSKKRAALTLSASNLEDARRSDKTWRMLRIRKPAAVLKNDLSAVKIFLEKIGFEFKLIPAKKYKISVAYVPYDLYCHIHGFIDKESFLKMQERDFKEIQSVVCGFKAEDKKINHDYYVNIIKKASKKAKTAETISILADIVREFNKIKGSGLLEEFGDFSDGLDGTNYGDGPGGDPANNSNG